MKIGDEVYIHGYVGEIREDTIIICNDGGYFGSVPSEIVTSVKPECKKGKWLANGDIPKECPFCGEDWDKYVYGDEVWYTGELPNFCPNCGADMRGLE